MANEYVVNASDLTAVADAIRDKGETTGQLSFPGGFINAVQNIQKGITVQEASGTAQSDGSGILTINCGFRPDMLILYGEPYYDGEDGATYCPAIGLPLADLEVTADTMIESMMPLGGNLIAVYPYEVTSNGVTSAMWWMNFETGYTQASNVSINYKALKYTE